ncbi:hypothetical protein CPC08DRAFT_652010 [Agrocybe pediades]|nr:hypothetical protein CPC08DRAFT_652010 [Agrocybe pediades]
MTDCKTTPSAETSSESPASRYTPSDLEARCYYQGISPTPPRLLYRTDLPSRPWVPPGPTKCAGGVFGHKLNQLWESESDNVGPKIMSFLSEEGVDWSSVELIRFLSYYEDDNEEEKPIKGPPVIWIGVNPDHAEDQADQIHRSAERIQGLLKDLDIEDVNVEYRASAYRLL